MNSYSKECFLGAIKNTDYELKIAIAIFFVITLKVKFEMYPLIKKEIGKVRKRFFLPVYPNIHEEREIIKSLSKLTFVMAINKIGNEMNDSAAKNIIGYFVGLIDETHLVDIDELDEISEMMVKEKNYLQKIAFDICDIIDCPGISVPLSLIISLIIANYLPFIVGQSINSILSCSKDDLVPTFYQLNGW